jgi:hypothetical protein
LEGKKPRGLRKNGKDVSERSTQLQTQNLMNWEALNPYAH